MDTIWYRNPSKLEVILAVVAGMRTTNDHAEPNAKKWEKKLTDKTYDALIEIHTYP